MLVRDEVDIIGATVRHLCANCDHVIVADNRSNDGTRDVLNALIQEGLSLEVRDDDEVAYYQSRKMTELAADAFNDGYVWAIPCDADEVWYATDGRPIRDYLAGVARDLMFIEAPMYHHLPTEEDVKHERNPLLRIGHRQREHGQMGKVLCRLRPGLEIAMGNHGAWAPGPGLTSKGGVVIRHFPWRTPNQFKKKIRNGVEAYAATDLPASVGEHWRQWEDKPDEAIEAWFWEWGYSARPRQDTTLILDPAPIMGH